MQIQCAHHSSCQAQRRLCQLSSGESHFPVRAFPCTGLSINRERVITERKIAQCTAWRCRPMHWFYIYCSSLLCKRAMLKRRVCTLDLHVHTFKREIMSCISLYILYIPVAFPARSNCNVACRARRYIVSRLRQLAISSSNRIHALGTIVKVQKFATERENINENALSVRARWVVVVIVGWWNGGNVKNMQIRQRATQRVKVSSFTQLAKSALDRHVEHMLNNWPGPNVKKINKPLKPDTLKLLFCATW